MRGQEVLLSLGAAQSLQTHPEGSGLHGGGISAPGGSGFGWDGSALLRCRNRRAGYRLRAEMHHPAAAINLA